MPDDLRTRIAAVLYQRYVRTLDVEYSCMEWEDIPDKESWLADADAVIRELGLVREFSIGDDEGGRVLWFDDEEPVAPREGEVVEVRYITGWTACE